MQSAGSVTLHRRSDYVEPFVELKVQFFSLPKTALTIRLRYTIMMCFRNSRMFSNRSCTHYHQTLNHHSSLIHTLLVFTAVAGDVLVTLMDMHIRVFQTAWLLNNRCFYADSAHSANVRGGKAHLPDICLVLQRCVRKLPDQIPFSTNIEVLLLDKIGILNNFEIRM